MNNAVSQSFRRKLELSIALLPLTATFLFAALCFFAKWPNYWEWIANEQTPFTWLQSVLLLLVSTFCLLNALYTHLRKEAGAPSTWLFLGASMCFLALDERFAIHERVRDSILEPLGVTIPFLPWVGAGDFIVLGYFAVALVLLRRIIRVFRRETAAFRFFLAGFLLAALAVGADSFNVERMSVEAIRIEQTAEEIAEAFAFSCLLIATARITCGCILQSFVVGAAQKSSGL